MSMSRNWCLIRNCQFSGKKITSGYRVKLILCHMWQQDMQQIIVTLTYDNIVITREGFLKKKKHSCGFSI